MDINSYDYVIMNDYINHSGVDSMLIWEDLVFSVDDYDLVQIARASVAVLLIVYHYKLTFYGNGDDSTLILSILYKLRSVQNTGTCYPGQGWFVRCT